MAENPNEPIDWTTHEGKKKIFQHTMKYFKDKPAEYTRSLKKEFGIGREIVIKACEAAGDSLEIPPEARVLFLPDGDNMLGHPPPFLASSPANMGDKAPDLASQSSPQLEQFIRCGGIPYRSASSLIITLPPLADIEHDPTDIKLLDYACSYIIW